MTRRDVIKQTALLTGYALTASMMQGILNGCQAEASASDWKPTYFRQEQADLISELTNTILPRTGTPGAIDAGVPQYIEMMVHKCLQPRERDAFLLGLRSVNPTAIQAFGKPFAELQKKEQEKVLVQMESTEVLEEIERRERSWKNPFETIDRESVERVQRRQNEMESLSLQDLEQFEMSRLNNNYPFFLRLKQMTLAGYFSSKLVGEEVTNYDPVPGVYKGCIPLSEVKNKRIYSL